MESKRGREKRAHDGHSYVFDKFSADEKRKLWRCEQKDRCKARMHTCVTSVELVKIMNDHSHDSDPAKIAVKETIMHMKKRAAETVEGTAQVINQALQNLPDCALGVLPTLPSMKKVVRRIRNEVNLAPASPSSLLTLVIPPEYQTYHPDEDSAEPFLLADSGPGEDRILIFGREKNCHNLRESDVWYIDGTFSVAPKLFAQVYVVLAEKYGGVHPFVYACLPDKSELTYMRMFAMMKGIEPNIRPRMVNCDFELPAINAVQTSFPDADIGGCFFHLVSNMKKQIGRLGLSQRYKNDMNFALRARMVTSQAFVPPDHVEDSIEILADTLPDDLKPLLDWFEDYYVGRPDRRGRRRPPRFPVQMWNVYERTLEGSSRTNNHAEAANRRLSEELNVDHPTLWRFIEALRRVQKGGDAFYESQVAGHPPTEKLKKYRDADERIIEKLNDSGA